MYTCCPIIRVPLDPLMDREATHNHAQIPGKGRIWRKNFVCLCGVENLGRRTIDKFACRSVNRDRSVQRYIREAAVHDANS